MTRFWTQHAHFCKKRPSKHQDSVASPIRVPGQFQKTSFSLFLKKKKGPEDPVQGALSSVVPHTLRFHMNAFAKNLSDSDRSHLPQCPHPPPSDCTSNSSASAAGSVDTAPPSTVVLVEGDHDDVLPRLLRVRRPPPPRRSSFLFLLFGAI